MASPIEGALILADSAQAASGKVHMLGAGWSITGSPTAPSAVVGLIKIPWDRTNQKIQIHVQLVNEDGHPVVLGGMPGLADQPVEFKAEMEAGRPPGVKPGTPIDASFAFNVGPMPLPPGRYTWVMRIGDDEISSSFSVVEAAPHPQPF